MQPWRTACRGRCQAAAATRPLAGFFFGCAEGRRRSRPGRSRGSGWRASGLLRARSASSSWFLTFSLPWCHVSCLVVCRCRPNWTEIVTYGRISRRTGPFHDCTCLIKCYRAVSLRAHTACPAILPRKLRLDGNRLDASGDKARHENVFRHLWHLHYWLASRWSGRFRLLSSKTGQTPRPAGRGEAHV